MGWAEKKVNGCCMNDGRGGKGKDSGEYMREREL